MKDLLTNSIHEDKIIRTFVVGQYTFHMEAKSENEKTDDIQKELQGAKIFSRPKNFSFQSRREVYYFSEQSARGILKRVPVKDGNYRINEQRTVLEDSDAAKARNDVWEDIPINISEGATANKNQSGTKNDDSYQSMYRDEETMNFLKSLDKIARYKPRKYDANNLLGFDAYKNNTRSKQKDQVPVKFINQDKKKSNFHKPTKGFEKKKRHSNASAETDSEKLKGSISDEKHKKLSFPKKSCSSTKPKALKESHECLSVREDEESLNDALSKMLLKTPTSEL